ncbi:MAG: hypothetical protein EOP10_31800 [Proteobacteria bacterium]|nr:MAG: hypothetical protein EOP10_31800 [Pseudomonadota bacterium]
MKREMVLIAGLLYSSLLSAQDNTVENEVPVVSQVDEAEPTFDESQFENEFSIDEDFEIMYPPIGALDIDTIKVMAAKKGLSCTSKVYNTAVSATCTGKGRWRIRYACKMQGDKVGDWVNQTSGTSTVSGECRHKATAASVEIAG